MTTPPHATMPLHMPVLGDVLASRYRLVSILGEGGMGTVYEATQIDLNRPVAVKVMLPQDDRKGEAVARFVREARVTAALHHPGVVKIFDFGRDEAGRFFLVMERLVGSMLRSHVGPDGVPSLARTLDIGAQMADVLVSAHAMGLVHRDLKPENVFLERNLDGSDRVVVVDFGLGYIEEREDAQRFTKEGVITGTPAYMSPEQCAGKGVGTPSDVYALGCIVYEMVAGVVPFEGQSLQLLVQHSFEEPKPPSQKRPGLVVPRGLELLILDMLRKTAAARPTAAQVLERLRHLASTREQRDRGRNAELLEGRAARMIPTVNSASEATGAADPDPAEVGIGYRVTAAAPAPGTQKLVAVVGALTPDLQIGLGANGLAAKEVHGPPLPPGTTAIFAPRQTDVVLQNLISYGVPVLTDGDAEDLDGATRLLALGVADVVSRPVRIEQLVSKLQRAIKKAARRR